jgi:hypothetical protein
VSVSPWLCASTHDPLDSYVGNVDAAALMAGWFSICLLGRVLFNVALRSALVAFGCGHLLMDLVTAARAVGSTR